jgi:hypothetical protein
MGWRSEIRNRKKPIPDLGVKKAPDPGSGTLEETIPTIMHTQKSPVLPPSFHKLICTQSQIMII